MESEKSRPNLFREICGGLKVTITLLLALFAVMNGFAQQFIDIVNAPLNPIAYIENKNQLNVKGDIAFYNNANEGFIYFDKNGNRLFNLLYTLYTDKEKARINKGTYLELDNQKKVVYKENFYFNDKTFYTYNPNGTISKVERQGEYPSATTYEYDNKKRKIKEIEQKDAKTTVIAYTYQAIGNRIVISASETVTENNQSKSRTFEYAYENGLLMKFTENGFEDNHTYTYDTKGNWVTNSFRFGNVNKEFYYHSELGQWDKWRWIYKKTNTTYSPYLMIGNRQIRMLIIGFNDLDNFTDILFYEPITATTLVAENAVTTTGLSQGTGDGKIRTLKAKNLMYLSKKGNIKFFVAGDNKSGNIKQKFVGKYVIYDTLSSQTYWCLDFDESKKFNVFEDLGKDALLWYKSEKNDVYFWQKGDFVSTSGYTLGETLIDGSKLLYKNQKPALVLESFTTSTKNIFYKAVPYSGQSIHKNTTPAQTTTTAGANTKPINLIGKSSTAKITADTKYGFADEKGNLVISYHYQDYQKFSDGFAFVKLNDKWGVIDHTGKTVVPFKYDYALEFSGGLAGVKLNNKWGYIDPTGKVVIPIQYQGADDFSEGLASVALNGKWGFVDRTGKLIIPYRYDYKEKFSQGLAGMSINDKYGFIDKTGKIVIPFIYDNVLNFKQDGKAQVRLGSESFYIDKTGKRINK